MFLKQLSLQHFRSYPKAQFTFSSGTTLIVGPNTAGKTNIIEAIFLLASGKSFRAEKDVQVVEFEKSVGRVKGEIQEQDRITDLEVVIANTAEVADQGFLKRFLVNSVPKRRVDFAGHLKALLFTPSDLDIAVGSPGKRRAFLDDVLDLIDREYRIALTSYTKGLRQRNALLEAARETGRKNDRLFDYWDDLLIQNGQLLTAKREAFIEFINNQKKDLLNFQVTYDKSTISEARLLQYKDAEIGAAITLVGPHRDDFFVSIKSNGEEVNVKQFGSRGQQRLAVLQLKLLQLSYMEQIVGERPLLLLDDIFSELDTGHIRHVMDVIKNQQTIITTTHKEFVDKKHLRDMELIELGKKD